MIAICRWRLLTSRRQQRLIGLLLDNGSNHSQMGHRRNGFSSSRKSGASPRTEDRPRNRKPNKRKLKKIEDSPRERKPDKRKLKNIEDSPRERKPDKRKLKKIEDSPRERKPDKRKLKKISKEKSRLGSHDEKRTTRIQVDRSLYPPNQIDAVVVCHPGLDSFLSQELELLGIEHSMESETEVKLHSANASDLLRCHLYLGTASQILLRCGPDFHARGWPELIRKVQRIPWTDILEPQARLSTKVTSINSKLFHTGAIQERIESAIHKVLGKEDVPSERLDGEDSHKPAVNQEGGVRLLARVHNDRVRLYLSSSPSPLHQRQYRLATGKAPLREDLAYALLWSTGLRPLYFQKESSTHGALLDPLCGSGTIAIEAAAMMGGLPPGRLHSMPFQGTCLYKSNEEWEQMIASAVEQSVVNSGRVSVSASDRDAGVIVGAKSNASRAGVEKVVDFRRCAFSAHPWFEKPSTAPNGILVVSNLPFGQRLSFKKPMSEGQFSHLLPMYQKLANNLNNLAGAGCAYTAVFLTNNPRLIMRSGVQGKVTTLFKMNHGGIPVIAVKVSPG